MYRKWRANRMIRRAHQLLDELDATMVAAGFDRKQRRRVWTEIRANRVDIRDLMKEVA